MNSDTTTNLNNVDVLSVVPITVSDGVSNRYVEVTVWNGDTYVLTLHDFDAITLARDLMSAATDRHQPEETV